MKRKIIFIHGRGRHNLEVKEPIWEAHIREAIKSSSWKPSVYFASYANEAYKTALPGVLWLIIDLFRWFAWPGRHKRRMEHTKKLHGLLCEGDSSEEVLIISHSMGTILAYEYLLNTKCDKKNIWFITMGSPLSWAPKMFLNLEKKALSTVSRWVNVFHQADFVAGTRWLFFLKDHTIADDFRAENPLSVQQPRDWAIYHFEAQPHSSDGYLDSRSMQNIIEAFSKGRDWPFDSVTK